MNPNTAAVVTASGLFPTSAKNSFRSDAAARGRRTPTVKTAQDDQIRDGAVVDGTRAPSRPTQYFLAWALSVVARWSLETAEVRSRWAGSRGVSEAARLRWDEQFRTRALETVRTS